VTTMMWWLVSLGGATAGFLLGALWQARRERRRPPPVRHAMLPGQRPLCGTLRPGDGLTEIPERVTCSRCTGREFVGVSASVLDPLRTPA